MNRLRFVGTACTLALVLPLVALVATAKSDAESLEKVVTEADNGLAVTLNAGETLVVRLTDSPSTGYSRAVVTFADMPVRLVSQQMLPKAPAVDGGVPVVGSKRTSEWKFQVVGQAKYGRAVWLKMPILRPFAKGIDATGLWEIKVSVPAS